MGKLSKPEGPKGGRCGLWPGYRPQGNEAGDTGQIIGSITTCVQGFDLSPQSRKKPLFEGFNLGSWMIGLGLHFYFIFLET